MCLGQQSRFSEIKQITWGQIVYGNFDIFVELNIWQITLISYWLLLSKCS